MEYSAADSELSDQVFVDSLQARDLKTAVLGIADDKSPRGTAHSFVRSPDTGAPGPWSWSVYVSGNRVRSIALAVRFKDMRDVRARWVTEKLLFIQAWPGRLVALELILDIESRRFVYTEWANYAREVVPCADREKR